MSGWSLEIPTRQQDAGVGEDGLPTTRSVMTGLVRWTYVGAESTEKGEVMLPEHISASIDLDAYGSLSGDSLSEFIRGLSEAIQPGFYQTVEARNG